MKSSPFKLFSLSAREADQRGNYANPELGRYKATTFDHPDLSGIKNSKPKAEKEDSNTSSYKIPIKEFKTNFAETPDMPNLIGNNNNNNNDGRGSRSASGSTTTTTGGKSYRQAYAEAGKPGETYKQYVERADQWHKDNPGNRPSSSTTTSSWKKDDSYSFEGITAMNMKSSPNKLIGDTMDPYGQINPGAVPPNQAQNDLGAQPIIGAQGSQPSARAIDMAAIGNPYVTPGADFNPQSKMKAESIFGSAGQRQGLMNLGTPLAHKTAAKHPEPHRKTKTFGGGLKPGDPYIVADNVDEGGSNPPDTLNLKKYKQPNYMSNPGDQYKKDQFPDEDIFYQNNDQLNKEGFNTDSTSSVRIFKN